MAGYIMTLGPDEYIDMFYSSDKRVQKKKNLETSKKRGEEKAKLYALEKCILDGVYSAKCPKNGAAFIGTLADYLGMKSGDDIYFFTNRKIYGIGKLIDLSGFDCRFRVNGIDDIDVLFGSNNLSEHPFVCTFVPSPYFFKLGVDMDEVLMFSPDKIRSLRFFSKRTFMKLDDVESNAIKNIIVRKNEQYLTEFNEEVHFKYIEDTHKVIQYKLSKKMDVYRLSVFDYIKYNKKHVESEYYIEGAIMDLLRKDGSKYIGKWDFIGRQYPASPPKPSEYEESMDLFGYRYVPMFPGAVSKYVVIELKVGTIKKEHVQQTMKYVDWISREYTKGDYSMIEAYTIGADKEDGIECEIEDIIERNYIIESRPVENRKWQNLRILSYYKLLQELEDKERDEVDE